jgi:dTDP-4-dehydrorhamnose 3,5-epimerase
MRFIPTKIADVILIQPTVFSDDRGSFLEMRHDKKFDEAGIKTTFVQDNFSYSKLGVLRGLHYQIKNPQGKLVRALSGKIFDVAVDMRKNSATFGQYTSEILSEENKCALWIPPGFAHGFYTLSEGAQVMYTCDNFYAPEFERTLIWNDVQLAIAWPLQHQPPILSGKDAAGVLFKEAEYFA